MDRDSGQWTPHIMLPTGVILYELRCQKTGARFPVTLWEVQHDVETSTELELSVNYRQSYRNLQIAATYCLQTADAKYLTVFQAT